MKLFDKSLEAAGYIEQETVLRPKIAIVAGTGLSGLSADVKDTKTILYSSIPHFPKPTVEGHVGSMVFGKIGKTEVVVMRGRFHYYEGYDMDEVTFPVRVMKALGIEKMIITNAAGCLNPDINQGDIVLIEDHINLHPANPLRGHKDERLGPRFPAMNVVYDKNLLRQAEEQAQSLGIKTRKGIYVGLQGPSLETMAEYKYMHRIGGDVVGMSTVPEVIVAAQCELKVLVISVCTNNPYKQGAYTDIEEVLAVAKKTGEDIRKIIVKMLA